MRVDLSNGDWRPVPGYEEYYRICKSGVVCNVNGHIIKPVKTKKGDQVDLRKEGQREKIFVAKLLEGVGFGANKNPYQ